MNKLIAFAAFVAGVAAPGAMASASTLTLDTITPVGSEFRYSYSMTLSGDEGFTSGSKFVVFDFGDYVAGSVDAGIYASLLAASSELTTLGMPLAPGVTDDPLIANLVFDWIGAPFNASGGPLAQLHKALPLGTDGFSIQAITNNGFVSGTPAYSQSFVAVPAQTPTGVPGVPEPTTWALMILGFGIVGIAQRRQPRPAVRFA